MAKGDLNPAIWSPTADPSYHLASLWVVLVGCGAEGSVQGPQQLPGSVFQHVVAVVCGHLPY